MKTSLFITILICVVQLLIGQNAIVGTGFSSGWGGGSCPTGTSNFNYFSGSFGSSFGATLQANGTGNQYFRFGISWDNTTAQRTLNPGSDNIVNPNQEYTLNSNCTTSGAMFINVPSTSTRYVFKTASAGTNPQGKFIVFALSSNPVFVTSVVSSPNTGQVSAGQSVTVKAILSGALPIGQSAYLRYTVDNWASSTSLEMSGISTVKSAAIPAQNLGTIVKYYVFTSGAGLNITHPNADLYTINGNNNGGLNYSYSVLANPAVIVTPNNPTHNQSVTIRFDATGSALEGATKVYLHAGLSNSQIMPLNFSHVTGNWGVDNGVGEMSPVPGSPENWQISLNPGLRQYFNANSESDIFGLNFLFRNATGTVKVDNGGLNYHNIVQPGNHFILTSPSGTTQVVQSGTQITITALSETATTSWILKDSTTSTPITVATLPGGTTFSYTFTFPDASTRRYRLTGIYNDGSKYKTFNLIGYLGVVDAPRPTGMKLGVNYDNNDNTKATLILHAPTYTRYKKGTGIVSGTGNTPPKSVVYVIGDFNNWTPSETYKMQRDRDGWNGTTDSDNDGDRGDYWWITLTGLTPGQEYVFQYLIDGTLQVADPYTHKVSDFDDVGIPSLIYPNLIAYPPQANDRASVLQTNAINPYVWTAPSFTSPDKDDLNIYELLIRDFTDEASFEAAITRLDYIKGLGINAIHIMPVSEFEGNSSWGYNPNFYFAADKAYGPAYYLKKLIDECHKRKMLVFNDLVLNHAFFSNVMAKMYWDAPLSRPATHNPWFNATHMMVRNTAGHWGVDWNHESEHTQVMVDSILGYWLSEFKFDGFRFDFTKGFGQTNPDDFPPGDDWASAYNQDRIDLLKRMVDRMWAVYPGSIAIFEHLAASSEDKVLADHGILMWSGVGHHNALKNFILGYNADNPNIYDSGIYNAPGRNFALPHWMSYPESHDEERLGYELMQFYNGPRTKATMIDRLKIAYGFNLLMQGPRMLWQFGELGYEVSINFNGRTGEKPTYWEYYDDSKRRELYTLISRILKIRNKYNIYGNTPDYGNIGLGSGNIHVPRVMRFSSNALENKHVIVVANLDPNTARDVIPAFDVTGTWYRYNGVLDQSPYTVNSSNQNGTYLLQPSEIIVFTNFIIDQCTDVRNTNNSGSYSLRDAIDCAPDGGSVQLEFPVYNDTINLTTPINIDKNISISGFFDRNVTVSGSSLTQPVFNITAGKIVSIDGITITCATNATAGRCIINNGNLQLANTIFDDGGVVNGSGILNQSGGLITIDKDVIIK